MATEAAGLVLTARIEETNDRHYKIGVFQNGGKAGVLTVEGRHAHQVVGLINAAQDCARACRVAHDTTEHARERLSEVQNASGHAYGRYLNDRD